MRHSNKLETIDHAIMTKIRTHVVHLTLIGFFFIEVENFLTSTHLYSRAASISI